MSFACPFRSQVRRPVQPVLISLWFRGLALRQGCVGSTAHPENTIQAKPIKDLLSGMTYSGAGK